MKAARELPTLATAMTPFPQQIPHDASLLEAHKCMSRENIRHLVVTRDGDIYSILSERDLGNAAAHYGKDAMAELCVDDICAPHVFMADLHDPIETILDVMWEKRLGATVVLREGELAGIFTASDACHHFAELLRKLRGEDLPPEAA